ncbi:hypothetical protein Tco_0748450 [Tanacetum coccineum]|uniref:Uncharacterized protein n=1 Tax=Tanacetum coccineum TaxID=301880 RepID=A0ABQ4YVN7_9ASTR
MELCTKLSERVLDLEKAKTAQAKKIDSLKKRVKKLEKRRRSRTLGMNLFKIGTSRIRSLGFDADMDEVFKYVKGDAKQVISAVADEVPTGNAVNTAGTEVNTASAPVTTTGVSVSTVDPVTTVGVETLMDIRSVRPKAKGISFREPEEERLVKKREEDANIVECDDVQAMMNADYKLAARLQAEEQGELSVEEKSRLFVELMDKRKKHFSRLREEEQRRKPLTKAQKRNQIEIRVEGSSKRAGEDLQQESTKKQKMDDDKKKESLNNALRLFQMMEMIADGKTQMYLTFSKMLKNFDREDLKTMFEHYVEDNVWKKQQGLAKVLNWKLYDSCGVHCVTIQSITFYLLVEKMYPLTNHTLHQMFNDVKLQVDYECEMAFDLLRLVKKQLKEGYVPE